ncbi:LLM class flavin-dependent oxidoreductase [Nonomuraea sp. NEAU-A123]|uniref:LLM class flavin-dependent oxidoreductase n=1 Tax=Nonomuraea sp. NEAU-A123 TaxID=2839649 RepID=UPI001BE4837B|nr:LLM class flavin-dependent oxidoreductase [Nonomuraea sp. NEAU-A123]MBT2226182.1 LLM class flavin-dependent oxidoreductase [Nonomuraea sp. NEAU-A123]
MRIGIFLIVARFPGQRSEQVLANALELIVAAEEAGFADAWIAEHHFMSYGVCPSATTLAAVAIGRTSRIGFGTAVSVLSTQHPVALAEQAAMLHHLSGGRFTLGVGRGGPWVDLEVFGTGLARFERGFEESLDVLLAALSSERVSAAGEFFSFREVPLVPPARLRPVVACTSPPTVALAAKRDLPMLLGMHIDDEQKKSMIARYESHGGGAQAHMAAVVGYVANSTAQARNDLRESLPRWLKPGLAGYIPVDNREPPSRDVSAYIDFLTRVHPVGSPDRCVESIMRTSEATGIQHLILMVEGMGDHQRTLENIRRLGAEVLPQVTG